MFNKCVIISGGSGTRMLPLTNYIPKASVRLGDVKLAEYSIKFLRQNKIDQIYMTYGHLPNELFKDFKNIVDVFINTRNRDNSFFLTQTVISEFDEPIIVLPCDIIFEIDLEDLYLDYLNLGSPEIMLVPTNYLGRSDGDFIHEKNNIVEKLNRTDETPIYCSGIQVINPKKLNSLIEFKFNNFYEIWNSLINKKKLKVSNVRPIKWSAYDKITDILQWNGYQ